MNYLIYLFYFFKNTNTCAIYMCNIYNKYIYININDMIALAFTIIMYYIIKYSFTKMNLEYKLIDTIIHDHTNTHTIKKIYNKY